MGAEGSGRVFNFLLSLAGARFLGPAGWGLYWSAFSVAQVLASVTDLGNALTLAREVAHDRPRARGFLGASLALRLMLVLGVLLLWAPLRGSFGLPTALFAAMLAALLCLSFVEWLGYYLRGFGLVVDESLLLAMDCVLACGFGVGALLLGAGPVGLAGSQVAAHGLALALTILRARRLVPLRPSPATREALARFAIHSLPTGLALLAGLASWRLGVIALHRYGTGGEVDVGLFSAAHRIIESMRFLPFAIAAAAYPSFAGKKARIGLWRVMRITIPTGIAMGVLLWFQPVSAFLMRLALGPAYEGAAPVLSILGLALVFISANSVLSHWLIARRQERGNAVISVLYLAVNAIALYAFVPTMGMLGAAWGLVIAEGVYSVAGIALSVRRGT